MALVKISGIDKKTIIWNFMEELWENYVNALENNICLIDSISTTFSISGG